MPLPKTILAIPTFDYNALASYYTSGSALGIKLQAEILKQGPLGDLLRQREIGVIPPWELPPRAPALPGEELRRIFSTRTLIDRDSDLFERTDVDDNFKNLFALYSGLTLLKELVTFAKTSAADSTRTILERQYQSYVGQAKDFVEDTRLSDVSLVFGLKPDTLASTVVLPRKSNSTVFFGATASKVDNIVSEINAQLTAALVDTTFLVERINETAYQPVD